MNQHKLTVLVVEDENLLLQAITRKLELNKMTAIPCQSGKDAIKLLNNLGEKPDIIWLDYYLKDMNGLEFMCSIKKNTKLADILTIVVSNSASSDKVRNMLALGVKKYYLKAENRLDDIISTIKSMLEEKQAANNNKTWETLKKS